MRRTVLASLLMICATVWVAPLNAQNANHSLKVFVNPLQGSNQDLANMVTAKLISHLVKHQISVVESVDDADAVLNLSGLVETSDSEYGHVHVRLQAGVRLVSKDGAVLWADDIRSSRYAESASSSFAENVATSLEKSLAANSQGK